MAFIEDIVTQLRRLETALNEAQRGSIGPPPS